MTTQELVERVAMIIAKHVFTERASEWPYAGKEEEIRGRLQRAARAALSAMPQRELLAEALDALTPFAVGARSIDVDPPGDHEPSHGRGSVTAGDLRRARAAADKIRASLTQEKQP